MPPYRIPLFPLGVVLFPGTALPLHIFEPRYRKLLADCLAGSRQFGITPAGAEGESPDPGMVGCVAKVKANEQLPDGRSNILVMGGARFVLRSVFAAPEPYYTGLVEEFDEEEGTLPPSETVGELRERFTEYYRVLRLLNDAEPEEPSLPDSPLALSFAVAAAIECDPAMKQALLVTCSACSPGSRATWKRRSSSTGGRIPTARAALPRCFRATCEPFALRCTGADRGSPLGAAPARRTDHLHDGWASHARVASGSGGGAREPP
jgi:Lon protease-like protein